MRCSKVEMTLPNSVIDNIDTLSKKLDYKSKSEFIASTILLVDRLYSSMNEGDKVFIESRNGDRSEFKAR